MLKRPTRPIIQESGDLDPGSKNQMAKTLVLERGDAVSPSSQLSSFAVYTPSYARAGGSVSTTHATEPLARVSEFHF